MRGVTCEEICEDAEADKPAWLLMDQEPLKLPLCLTGCESCYAGRGPFYERIPTSRRVARRRRARSGRAFHSTGSFCPPRAPP